MSVKRLSQILVIAATILASPTAARPAAAQQPAESKEARDARMKWWREARFGMFIHWGVYSVPAGTYKGQPMKSHGGEWILHDDKIPLSEYREFAKQFNPVKYDPEAWAALAEAAGMKYIVITSKHHDGFALFDTKVTHLGRGRCHALRQGPHRPAGRGGPAARPEVRPLLLPGPGLDVSRRRKRGYKEGDGWDEAHKGSFDKYLDEIAIPQVREILANYKPDVLWWDTPDYMTPERSNKFRPLLAPYPSLIMNNRLDSRRQGDIETPEQSIPATGIPGRDWETCMTMNGTWGYKSFDNNWKSTETLIRNLVDIASKGGNYLLNVGPTSEGLIPQPSVERLQEIGRWMKINGEAIYATTASPCAQPSWGRITTKAGSDVTTLYLHVFNWPASGELAVPVSNAVKSCSLLADRSRQLQTTSGEKGLTVKLTGDATDKVCSVVVLQIAGQPQVIGGQTPKSPAKTK